jgi:hypothetical protein
MMEEFQKIVSNRQPSGSFHSLDLEAGSTSCLSYGFGDFSRFRKGHRALRCDERSAEDL